MQIKSSSSVLCGYCWGRFLISLFSRHSTQHREQDTVIHGPWSFWSHNNNNNRFYDQNRVGEEKDYEKTLRMTPTVSEWLTWFPLNFMIIVTDDLNLLMLMMMSWRNWVKPSKIWFLTIACVIKKEFLLIWGNYRNWTNKRMWFFLLVLGLCSGDLWEREVRSFVIHIWRGYLWSLSENRGFRIDWKHHRQREKKRRIICFPCTTRDKTSDHDDDDHITWRREQPGWMESGFRRTLPPRPRPKIQF